MRGPSEATTLCRFCPKLCRHACPVADADPSEAATPWGKMTAMKMVEENKLPMDRDTMGLAYKCLTCRGAEGACELDNPVSASLATYRVRAFRAGLTPGGVEAFCETFQRHNNPFDKDLLKILERRFPEAVAAGKSASGRPRTAYFPGCTQIVKNPEAVERALALLDGAALYSEPIQCCGYPLFAAGDWEGFVELAEVNSHALKDYDRILSEAPACLYTLDTLYRSAGHGVGAKFEHIAEYLVAPSALPALRVLPRPPSFAGHPVSVAYHDPCYLGRYRKTYEEPRELIRRKTGRAPVEFLLNREDAACCGAGGLLPVSFPDIAAKVTKARVEGFRRTGADLLVTSCPTCVQRFREFGVPAQGLAEFLSPSNKKAK